MRLGVLSPQKIQDIQDIFTGLYRITGLYRTYRVLQDFTGFTGCGKPDLGVGVGSKRRPIRNLAAGPGGNVTMTFAYRDKEYPFILQR